MSASPLGDAAAPAPPKTVGAVVAAVGILRCLGAHADSLRLLDIVEKLGLNSSTTLNILRTLEFEGLVSFDRRSKRYALASGLADLAALAPGRSDRNQRIGQAMRSAAHELDATLVLWRVVGDEVELLQVAESAAVMRIGFMVGRRLPMFLGAVGRLVAARGDWSSEELESHFKAAPWSRRPEHRTWLEEVKSAKATGWAADHGYVNLGVLGVAVPVEVTGELVHIVSLALFETETPRDLAPIVSRLRAVADA